MDSYQRFAGLLACRIAGAGLIRVFGGPSTEDHMMAAGDLNRLIMDLATSLADRESANLHVIHAWRLEGGPCLHPVVVGFLPGS